MFPMNDDHRHAGRLPARWISIVRWWSWSLSSHRHIWERKTVLERIADVIWSVIKQGCSGRAGMKGNPTDQHGRLWSLGIHPSSIFSPSLTVSNKSLNPPELQFLQLKTRIITPSLLNEYKDERLPEPCYLGWGMGRPDADQERKIGKHCVICITRITYYRSCGRVPLTAQEVLGGSWKGLK